jgi:hypothetical protein
MVYLVNVTETTVESGRGSDKLHASLPELGVERVVLREVNRHAGGVGRWDDSLAVLAARDSSVVSRICSHEKYVSHTGRFSLIWKWKGRFSEKFQTHQV